jgi:hypothetical protein
MTITGKLKKYNGITLNFSIVYVGISGGGEALIQ